MRAKIALLTIVALACGALYTAPAVSAVASSSWDQTIRISVPLRDTLIDFTMVDATNGDGSETNPYQTYTSSISLSVTIAGAGEIVVTDTAGNVIYTYTKTSSGTQTLTFTTNLTNGVGLYELTATFTDLDNPSNIYGSKSIFISYLATPIIPIIPAPSAPDTGIVYIGDKAFLVRDFGIIIVGVGIIVSLVVVSMKKISTRTR